MSLFGSMTTAISGLTAQARALGHVSDNVANSQTVGFKRTDTNFVSFLTDSTQVVHRPGSVVARPDYTNTVQGTIEQSENPIALAIAGQGFFSVALPTGTTNGQTTFDERQFFTRGGDFQMDRNGYMVNGAGYFLQGWSVDATGEPDRTQIQPIRVSDLVFNPIATSSIELSANLPAGSVTPSATPLNIYDSLGTIQPLILTWTPGAANVWTLDVSAAGAGGSLGTIDLNFGAAATPAATDGTIGEFANATGTMSGAATVTGDPALISFTADFGQGPQNITLNIGAFGAARGVTQYAGEEFELRNLAQDGVPLGAYSSTTVRENGDVAINYDNGQARVIARVPVTTFNAPDMLQRLDGQAFMRTLESGEARTTDPASNGAGRLSVGSIERSNVDIAAEFSKLIVAQRAYTANTRIVTASDEMLQDTINMRR
ncbi:flagellar hook protein FlgE [Roseomonas fluvialis]|uniref:Flagellar hook protein FlgE n=1 Tax=Roseomonas fluvialis TaxID=1750527 RepID=A0ABM7Y6M0_9PROT|nr:flagellar hook protein FlgE [Roseomonas fluvialis]BDG73573.1 flagellar hook protein FlgE [Roseomonas fluvialis]